MTFLTFRLVLAVSMLASVAQNTCKIYGDAAREIGRKLHALWILGPDRSHGKCLTGYGQISTTGQERGKALCSNSLDISRVVRIIT